MNRTPLAILLAALVPQAAVALDWDNVEINGYSSFEFESQLTDEGNGDPNHSFDADLFDIVFNFQVNEKVRASLDVTWEHGAASEDGRGNVAMEYGFVEYAISNLARIQVGKMFIPFGVFNEVHTAKPAFLSVKEAAATNKPKRIVDGAPRFFPRWGVGVNLRGDAAVGDSSFDYDLMITNGDQEESNPYEEDNNASKSITGRVRGYIGDIARFGLSFNYDKPEFDGIDTQTSLGFETRLSLPEITVQLEAVYGEYSLFEVVDDTKEILPTKRQFGAVIQVSHAFETGLTPYLQGQMVDPDADISDDRGFLIVTGLNWEIDQLILKLEHNYMKGQKESSLSELPNSSFHEVKAAVVLGF